MNKKMDLLRILGAARGDIYGGLTAAVVALPLALAFGVASGAGAISGLYGAILVGFFASMFGGTPTQVSGPTGPMTVIMTAIIMQYAHDPSLAFAVVIAGGALQICFGLLGWGKYVSQMPYPVVSGFMSGIGCIIIILQLSTFFGYPPVKDGILSSLEALPMFMASPNIHALISGAIALAVVIMVPKKIHSIAPPPLLALIIGTLVGFAFITEAPIIGEIPRGIPALNVPVIPISEIPSLLGSAFILATLGTIDSLLTSLVADNLTRTQHDSNRELFGQGIGNIVAGFFGGIPGAGATMRTVVNIKAGARTKLSGILHSVVLALVLLGFAPIAENIPLAVLAGILIKVGWDIIDWNYIKRLNRGDPNGLIVMLSVLVLTVIVDLIIAVGVGLILQFLLSAKKQEAYETKQIKKYFPKNKINNVLSDKQLEELNDSRDKIGVIELNGPFSFCSAKELASNFGELSKYEVAIINLTRLEHIDTSVALTINDLLNFSDANDNQVIIAGLSDINKNFLNGLKILNITKTTMKSSLTLALAKGKEICEEAGTVEKN